MRILYFNPKSGLYFIFSTDLIEAFLRASFQTPSLFLSTQGLKVSSIKPVLQTPSCSGSKFERSFTSENSEDISSEIKLAGTRNYEGTRKELETRN